MSRYFAVLLLLALPGIATAHTFQLSVVENSVCGTGDSVHNTGNGTAPYPDGSICVENGGLADTNVARLTNTGGDSASGNGTATLNNSFGIDAAVVADAFIFNSEYQELEVSYLLTFDIDTNGSDPWVLTLDHDVLGLLALHGDGTLSAVGTQDNGHAHVSTVVLSGDVSTSLLSDTAFNDNPSNNGKSSLAFSDGATGLVVASGTGDTTLNVSIDFTLDAFSNDGCSGFICSSASGGEDAAVLFGIDDASGLGDVDADEYGVWGRAVGPDGYNSLWKLSIAPVGCGNGLLDSGEECDDGNLLPNDGCSPTCQFEQCGDGVLQAGEECDDGNVLPNDGCSEFCVAEFCGDGILQTGLGEQCDDGNMFNFDGCSSTCQDEVVLVPSASTPALFVIATLLATLGLWPLLLRARRT